MANISALLLLTFVSLVFAEEQKEMEEDPFTFDYHRLRVGGLILAAVLCLIGITILFRGGQEAMPPSHSTTKLGPVSARNQTPTWQQMKSTSWLCINQEIGLFFVQWRLFFREFGAVFPRGRWYCAIGDQRCAAFTCVAVLPTAHYLCCCSTYRPLPVLLFYLPPITCVAVLPTAHYSCFCSAQYSHCNSPPASTHTHTHTDKAGHDFHPMFFVFKQITKRCCVSTHSLFNCNVFHI